MIEVERLRLRAQRCLRLARLVPSAALSAGFTSRAAEFLERAAALEEGLGQPQQQDTQMPPPLPGAGQQPALQQQQIQPKKDESGA